MKINNSADLLKLASDLFEKSLFFEMKKWLTIQDLVAHYPDSNLTDRKSSLHLSASALVFEADRLFFVHHPYLHKVLLPAGHVERGEVAKATALREFFEETGYQFQVHPEGQLVDMNAFFIPANPIKNEGPHHHIDLRYYFKGKFIKKASPELKVNLLTQAQAPQEFKTYFQLINK